MRFDLQIEAADAERFEFGMFSQELTELELREALRAFTNFGEA
jgi:hypothetical protein